MQLDPPQTTQISSPQIPRAARFHTQCLYDRKRQSGVRGGGGTEREREHSRTAIAEFGKLPGAQAPASKARRRRPGYLPLAVRIEASPPCKRRQRARRPRRRRRSRRRRGRHRRARPQSAGVGRRY